MRFTTCRTNTRPMSRCHTPLVEICDTTTQIRLDLGSCGICSTTPTALLLRKGGCPEYETVCIEPEPVQTQCCPTIPRSNKRQVEVAKPSIIYPLHEIAPNGESVYVLDGKMKAMGYGRWHGVILLEDENTYPAREIPHLRG